MSSNNQKEKETKFSKSASDLMVHALAGKENTNMESGDYIEQKTNIISGPTYDCFVFLNTLKNMGYDTSKEILALAVPLIGGAKDFAERGMRGEIENILVGNAVNSKNNNLRSEGAEVKMVMTQQEENKE